MRELCCSLHLARPLSSNRRIPHTTTDHVANAYQSTQTHIRTCTHTHTRTYTHTHSLSLQTNHKGTNMVMPSLASSNYRHFWHEGKNGIQEVHRKYVGSAGKFHSLRSWPSWKVTIKIYYLQEGKSKGWAINRKE